MAYEVPQRWEHGNVNVSAANINKYTNSIIALEAIIGSVSKTYATLARQREASFTLYHTRRWLWFTSTGAIVDPSGIGTSVSISEVNDTFTAYDLDTVEWLTYGSLYTVTGVGWCQEAS